ncbi:type II secretion system GspH family protein [Candidatus Gracilibacteria bacterium]|nr:type II secretion system GspH family protein [Candidatus Gracilibacteria bacterium]
MNIPQRKGFTLVELIVVITILAILGTIAFIALQEYPLYARNVKRIADISTIANSLNIFKISAGHYPEPNNTFSVTYNGAIAWTQGDFGEIAFKNVANLSKIPSDPLTQNYYSYSITNHKTEFELGAIQEGGFFITNPLSQNTYAALLQARAYTDGDYNGQMLRVSTGSTDYILSVPTILTSEIQDMTIEDVIANNSFVFNGYRNAPGTYISNGYSGTGAFQYNPINLVAWSGSLQNLENESERALLATNLKTNYNNTPDLQNQEPYSTLIDTDEENATAFVTNAIAYNNGGLYVNGIDEENVVPVTLLSSTSSGSGSTGGDCVFGSSNFGECNFQ